jgi:hypothetical protein
MGFLSDSDICPEGEGNKKKFFKEGIHVMMKFISVTLKIVEI